jgi:hypothetical protein
LDGELSLGSGLNHYGLEVEMSARKNKWETALRAKRRRGRLDNPLKKRQRRKLSWL